MGEVNPSQNRKTTGSTCTVAELRMIGTVNQIAWAVQIKSQVDAEFDRVRRVLEHAMKKQPTWSIADIESIIQILEEKRTEVMGNEQAGYFIHAWQELRNQVSRMIVEDPKYQTIKASQAARYQLPSPDTDDRGAKTPRQ